MFNRNWHYYWPIVAPNVAPTVDQTCTFQCLIPINNLSKYNDVVTHHLVGMVLKGPISRVTKEKKKEELIHRHSTLSLGVL